MRLPNLTTATAQQIIDHEKKRAMTEQQYNRELRQEYLAIRLAHVIEKLVALRDKL